MRDVLSVARHVCLASAGALALVAVVAVGPRRSDLPGRLASPDAWLEWSHRTTPDVAVATLSGLAAYAVVAWLLLGVAAAAAAHLPGSAGRVAAALASAITPGVLRRVVAATVGATLTTGIAVPAAADTGWSGLDWPDAPSSTAPRSAPAPTPTPATTVDPRVAVPHEVVVVAPGDCLWSIAARHLPSTAGASDIAAAWPQWYAANRAVIGPNPGLIRPGQHLTPPA